ncbi:MAG: sugar ABC transporter ATP-binding protein, partial [Phycisphaeraceae bacterium]
MNILAGLLAPSAGRVLVRGKPVQLHSASDAQRHGIAMIHQELNLVDELSVAENIYLGREWTRAGLLDRKRTHAAAREHLDAVGCLAKPGAKVGSLSIAAQQMVEIAKALSQNAKVLIMDEPTAVLTRREVALLMGLIRRLRERGVTVIYISHVLPEVLAISDRITVLRDGRHVTTLTNEPGLTEHRLASLMVGRSMGQQFPERGEPGDEVVLKVRGLCVPGHVKDVSFEVRAGEIVGFGGLIGAGRTEMAEGLMGLRRTSGGEVALSGKPLKARSPGDAVRAGLAYLSEDRRGRGLVMGMPVVQNTTLVSLKRYCRPLIRRRAETAATQAHVDRLGIKAGRLHDLIDTLSGGNQQKVALAKWLEIEPRVLIVDEPTRGVDVGAKAEIYALIHELAAQGLACVFISSEMNELLGMCHRIAVMRAGRVAAMLDGATATEEQIMQHAAGVGAAREPSTSGRRGWRSEKPNDCASP